MNTKMIVALLIALPVGVMCGDSCMAGKKLKATLTNLKCSSATVSAAACADCCEKDTTKCGGNTVTCASGKYPDATKAGTAGGTDDAARKTACCTVQATCAAAMCAAGMKVKPLSSFPKCTSDAASCASGTCCEKDTTKCGGNTVTCGAGKYLDATKADKAGGADDAARKTACCTDMATCAVATCAAGWKAKTSAATTKCTSDAASCVSGTCCEKDTTKCGGNTFTCGAGKYQDATKAGTAGGADDAARKTACCTDMATCAAATTCTVTGMKVKASFTLPKCTSDAASCVSGTCCEKDTTKCGGNTLTCGAGKYQDATKAGTAGGADDAARKTACCTDMATCAVATCAAGWKAKTSAASTKCTSDAASCVSGTCCEKDATKCGGQAAAITCDSTDVAKAADTAGTTKAQCCMTKPAAPIMATCAAFQTQATSVSTSGAQKTAMSLLFAVAGVVAL